MNVLGYLIGRLRGLHRAEQIQDEIAEEMRFHLEERAAEFESRGMTPAEAQREAKRLFGNVDRLRAESFDVRGGRWLESTWQDLRYGARMLLKNPGFTATVMLTLALGIGANITIFSVVNAVLLRPLPYPEVDRLAYLFSESPKHNIKMRASAYGTILEWRRQNTSFDEFAIFDPKTIMLTGGVEAEKSQSFRHTANLFKILGVAPALGRSFTAEEEQQKARVVVITHGLWQRRFGASPQVLGQRLEIDGVSSEVIGVLPENFEFATDTDLWEPITLTPDWEAVQAARGAGTWRVIGRLKDGVSFTQAQMEMDAIALRLETDYPDSNKDLRITLVPFRVQRTPENVRLALWILFGAVVCVLLIACTNVANMMLARGLTREREIALRMALGAGRWRLIRQLLTESILLALLSGAVGLLLARWGVKGLLILSPENIPRLDGVAIDVEVMAFAMALSLLTGILFGLVPALKISDSRPGIALKDGRSASGGPGGRRLRGLLIITEFGLAVLLLSGAGLLVRSFLQMQAVDPGFDAERILIVQTMPALKNREGGRWTAYYQQMSERVAALPGVESVGLAEEVFFSGNPGGVISVERSTGESIEQAGVPYRSDAIDGGFFQTLRTPLRAGRFFNAQDNKGSMPVAIINESMARRFWPDEVAVGKRIKPGPARSNTPWLTVVGVVGDMRRQSVERQPIPQLFVSYLQTPDDRLNLIVRTVGDPAPLVAVVQNELRAVDKNVPVYGIATMESRLASAAGERRFQTWLLTLFSAAALVLAAVGIYGLMHQSVALRTREIGLRVALGAQSSDVIRLIVGQGMWLTLCGIAVGVLAAFWLTRILSGLLFGVTATDPLTFIAVPSILILVALLACYLPARRATKVDPMVALRVE